MEKINSCVVTVFNEDKTIGALLTSLLSQSRVPDEIIIVDAGSKDNTCEIVREYIQKNPKRIRLFIKNGNRAFGRNYGIKKSTGNIILVTDAGCIPNKNWAQNLLKHFSKGYDVVSGFYYPRAKTPFEKALSVYTCVMEDRVDPDNYLPSSRSVAFTKKAWKKVGGYPEYLDTCEDLVFARNLKKNMFSFIFEKKAYVIWPQKKDLVSAFFQLYGYAKGDGQALYIRKTTPFLFLRYVIGIAITVWAFVNDQETVVMLMGIMVMLYLLWSIQKNYTYIRIPSAFFLLPALQLISDVAVISGMTVGAVLRFNSSRWQKRNTSRY